MKAVKIRKNEGNVNMVTLGRTSTVKVTKGTELNNNNK